MAKNVCPMCKEIVVCFGDEISVRCLKCETVFEVKDNEDEN